MYNLFMEELKKKITSEFGPRCKDRNRLCACCIAWEAYDTLEELLAIGGDANSN